MPVLCVFYDKSTGIDRQEALATVLMTAPFFLRAGIHSGFAGTAARAFVVDPGWLYSQIQKHTNPNYLPPLQATIYLSEASAPLPLFTLPRHPKVTTKVHTCARANHKTKTLKTEHTTPIPLSPSCYPRLIPIPANRHTRHKPLLVLVQWNKVHDKKRAFVTDPHKKLAPGRVAPTPATHQFSTLSPKNSSPLKKRDTKKGI